MGTGGGGAEPGCGPGWPASRLPSGHSASHPEASPPPCQTVRIQANGGVLMNSIYTQLPVSAGTRPWDGRPPPAGPQGACRDPRQFSWPWAAPEHPGAGSPRAECRVGGPACGRCRYLALNTLGT